jgi:alpha-beta hydrolase superfamily lysophospholipase
MHGEADGLVAVQDTYDFFQMATSKDRQMKIYGGLFHEIFNEYCRDEVIRDAISWIRNRI